MLFVAGLLCFSFLNAQEQFSVPQLTDEQKTEVLHSHVIAYAVAWISFAKEHGVEPEDYGKFIGNKFTAYWNPNDGFPMLVNRMMYILNGLHHANEMQIVSQNGNSITFKVKNVDLSFQNGPIFDVSYQDFLECSYGIISVVAKHMNSEFSHEMTNDGWYVVRMKKK